jgi:hypothetical protein
MTPQSNVETLPPAAAEELSPAAVETLPPPASTKDASRKRSGKRIDALLATRWGRLLVPSLSDFLFIALIAWLFMSSGAHGWQSLLADADVG